MKIEKQNMNNPKKPQLNIPAVSGSTSRFDFNSNTIEDAKNYINARSKQLLRHNYKLRNIEEFYWGISAYFSKDDKMYQSIYILEQYRNKGIYRKNINKTILTSIECGIEEYLISKSINYVCVSLTPFREYDIISNFYGNQKANRSGVHLMNHIDEGLFILDKIGASELAKKAYCLHPILQSDEALLENYDLLKDVDAKVIICLMEYRSVANEYLSKRKINSIDEIRLSPLKDVNDMLIADKIQNKKDFELYHKDTHHRSSELSEYFDNWLIRLNVSDNFYSECFQYCH